MQLGLLDQLSPSLSLSLSLAKLRLGLKWKQTATATNGIGIRSHEECSTHTYIHVQAGEHMYVCVCLCEWELCVSWHKSAKKCNAVAAPLTVMRASTHTQTHIHTHLHNCYIHTDMHAYVCMREWATVPSSLWFTHVEAGHWTCARALSTLGGARVQSAICCVQLPN